MECIYGTFIHEVREAQLAETPKSQKKITHALHRIKKVQHLKKVQSTPFCSLDRDLLVYNCKSQ